MKLFSSMLFFLISLNLLANAKFDYATKIWDAYFNSESITDLVIESINSGAYNPNDNILNPDGTISPSTLAAVLTDTYKDISLDQLNYLNSENARGLRFLLQKGLNPNQLTGENNINLILSSSRSCNLEAVKLLVSAGAKLNTIITDDLFKPITTRDSTGAGLAGGGPFGSIAKDSNVPPQNDPCFSVFKYIVDNSGIDFRVHECFYFSGYNSDDKYTPYLRKKYGPSYDSDCEKLDAELLKKIGL